MEQIYNYQDMSPEQRETALNALSSIGFCPAYGKVKTMQKIMDKSSGEKMPQFYFVFRDTALFIGRWIGYVGLIYVGVFGGYEWLRWYLAIITASIIVLGWLTAKISPHIRGR